jgi:hypothetical protein
MTEDTLEPVRDVVNLLPDLPDPEALQKQATIRLEGLREVKSFIDDEIAKCEMFLGVKPAEHAPVSVSDATYRRALEALAQGSGYQATSTVASRAHMALSSAGRAMTAAHGRGHASRETYGRKFKWRVTTAGEEFLTS